MALKTDVVSYWKCEESSGNLVDVLAAHDLTETGTVASGTGKIDNCRVLDDNEYFSVADHADFSPTGEWACCLWVNHSSFAASPQAPISKWLTTGNQRSYELQWITAADTYSLLHSENGSGTDTLNNATTVDSTGTWYFLCFGHDGTNIFLWVNSTKASQAAGATFDGTAAFAVGGRLTANSSLMSFDEVAFRNGSVWTDDEVAEIFNSGNGLGWDDWDASPGGVLTPRLTLLGVG